MHYYRIELVPELLSFEHPVADDGSVCRLLLGVYSEQEVTSESLRSLRGCFGNFTSFKLRSNSVDVSFTVFMIGARMAASKRVHVQSTMSVFVKSQSVSGLKSVGI